MSSDTTSKEPTTVAREGRTIAWNSYGDPGGRPVAYFHGAGGSRLEAQILDQDARAAGVRIISIDRPGSGRTDPMPGRTILSSVTDLPAVLDAEGITRVAVAGLSAGAMYAWAAAASYPEQITGVVAICPAVPATDPGVKIALSTQFKAMAFLSHHLPRLLSALQRRQAKGHAGPNGQANTVKTFRRISPADAIVLEDRAVFEWFRDTGDEGRRQGDVGGGTSEFRLMSSPWGFNPALGPVPTRVLIGGRDPLAAAQRALLTQAPGIIGCELAESGHIMIATPEGRAAVLEAMTAAADVGTR